MQVHICESCPYAFYVVKLVIIVNICHTFINQKRTIMYYILKKFMQYYTRHTTRKVVLEFVSQWRGMASLIYYTYVFVSVLGTCTFYCYIAFFHIVWMEI